MVQPRRYASLLLITASQDTAAQFARLLPMERFAPEYSVCAAREADYVLRESRYDVVVIDDSIPDSVGTALASAAVDNGCAHVLLLASADRFASVAEYAEVHGFMTLQSPVDPVLLRQSLGMMASASARIRELEEQAETLQAKMDEIRLVDRAKLILVQQLKMTEKESHRFIEKNAMDRCVTRRTIAESIIRTYQN